MPANVSLTSEQKVLVTLTPTTLSGNPAEVEDIVWSVDSGDATVEPQADPKSAYIISGPNVGASVIRVTADADLGEGVVELQDVVNVDVTSPQAANLGFVVGTPEPK